MQKPLLTVVIPVYNVEKYLRECLDSIVNQTYQNLEIIIVNDCSPDNSEEIILEYQKADPRVKYLKHETNRAQGAARNTGVASATGEWITFVDSDDYLELHAYETIMNLILKNNVDMGVFSGVRFDNVTKKSEKIRDYPPYIEKLDCHDIWKFPAAMWNKIFKLSHIIQHNILCPEHLKHEDYVFWVKYVALVEPSVIGCNELLFNHRKHPESTTQDFSNRHHHIFILENICEILIDNNKFDDYEEYVLWFAQMAKESLVRQEEWSTPLDSLFHYMKLIKELPFTDEDLKGYPDLLAIKYLSIDENTIEFLKAKNKMAYSPPLRQDKWYKFGQLSRTKKIKFIIKTILKRILIKLHLFEFVKKLLGR